jgi:universal stress protein E
MHAIRRILVAIRSLDAKSLPAVLKAAQIARACGAQIELYHGLDTPMYSDLYALADGGLPDLQQNIQQQALHRLDAMADRLRQHSIKVSVCAEWDFPAFEAIVRRAMHIKADLIVSAAHTGRHRLASLLRLTDWELVRQSPLPVLIVKNAHPYRHPAVLTAVDPTHAFSKPLQLDKVILQMGRTLSEGLKGTLHAVHAYARVPGGSLPEVGITPAVIDKIAGQAERIARVNLDRSLRSIRIARSRRYLIARDPANGIIEAAKKARSAIVVMGAVSRSGVKRLLIGNTAERILDELTCDILVVKAAKFRTRVPRATRGPHWLASGPIGTAGFY